LQWIEQFTGKSTYALSYNDYPTKVIQSQSILERLQLGNRG